jgi:hypothetical protein
MFHPDRDLRLIILEVLKEDGMSISAISRELEMTDLNVLKEKEVPPAKIYIVAKAREQNVYETVGEKVRLLYGEGEKSDKLILVVLSKLLHRAVFSDELSKAGVRTLPGHEASKEERQEAKQALIKSGFKVPDSLKAYTIEAPECLGDYSEVLTRLLADLYNINYLIKETKQTRLTF